MKTILILLSLSLGFFATADQNPDCQGSACLSEEQINLLNSMSEEQIKILRKITIPLFIKFLSEEQIIFLNSLSEEQIEVLQSKMTRLNK